VRYRDCEKKRDKEQKKKRDDCSIIVAFDIDVSLGSRGIVGDDKMF
jgi:hypothetical protein